MQIRDSQSPQPIEVVDVGAAPIDDELLDNGKVVTVVDSEDLKTLIKTVDRMSDKFDSMSELVDRLNDKVDRLSLTTDSRAGNSLR